MKRGSTRTDTHSMSKGAGSSDRYPSNTNILLSPAGNTRSRKQLFKPGLPEPEIHRSRSPVLKRRLNGTGNRLIIAGEAHLSPVLISSPVNQNACIPHSVPTPPQNQSFCNDSLANESFLFALDNVERKLKIKNKDQVQNNLSKAHEFDNGGDELFDQSFEELNQLFNSPEHSTPKSRINASEGKNNDADKNSVRNAIVQEKFVTESTVQPEHPKAGDRAAERQTKNKPNGVLTKESKKQPQKKKGGKRKPRFKTAYTNRKEVQLLSESGGNELSREDLSGLSEEDKYFLSSWGLPESIVSKYRFKGVTSLFKWQLDCLTNMKVFEGKNLVYSAPTSAGKTLVAEILMLKRVLELGKKAIMILPFVSVAREKMYSLQELFGDAGIRVEGFMGSYNPPGGFKAVDIAICTIEKANSLINRLLTEDSLSQLGTVVVDELHLVGDAQRGYLLELLLTKIKFMSSKHSLDIICESQNGSPKSSGLNIQVIGMSATLPNLPLLAEWLDAELVTTDYRPVPLSEKIKIGEKMYDASLKLLRPLRQESLQIDLKNDPDNVVYLTLETILEGHSVLIFCPTKAWCEKLAEQIAREFFSIGKPNSDRPQEIGQKLREQLNSPRIAEVLEQLNQCPAGKDEMLSTTAAFGVGFHHAGLTFDERDILEAAFKRGVLRVIVATSTLSAGVNLPARRVIIASPVFNGYPLDPLTYKQMSGRAGRKGVDTEGESILICQTGNHDTGIRLIQATLPAVKSALLGHTGSLTSSMKRALLEVVASGAARSAAEVQNYSKATLLSTANDSEEDIPASQNASTTIDECLQFLVDNEFIKLIKYEDAEKKDEYIATQLGSACLASSLSPDEGIVVFKELLRARQCFVLSNELHVIYQVTPIYLSDQWRNLNWHQFLKIYESLSPDELRVCQQVGVEETFILNAMMSGVSWKNPAQRAKLSIHQRFYTALALNDLVNEMPISKVGAKYEVNKGVIQNLQQAASTFAGMVTAFCSKLGWSNLELLLSQFQDRLQFGVQRELCDLVKLTLVNGQRARILHNSGIETVADLAAADPVKIEQIFHRAGPFSSNVHGEQGGARTVYVLGKVQAWTESEMAQMVVQEARQYLQIELRLEVAEFAGSGMSNGNKKPQSETITQLSPLALTTTVTALNEDKDAEKNGISTDVGHGSSGTEVENNNHGSVVLDVVEIANVNDGDNNSLGIEDILSELSFSLLSHLDDRERKTTTTTNVMLLDGHPDPVTVVNLDSDSGTTVSHLESVSQNNSAEMFEDSGPLLDKAKTVENKPMPSVTSPNNVKLLSCNNSQDNSNMDVDGGVYDIEEIGPSEEVDFDKDISFMDLSLNSVHLSDDGIATEFFIGNRNQAGDSKESASLFGTSSSSSEMFEKSDHSTSSVEIFPSATKQIQPPPEVITKRTKVFSPEPDPDLSSSFEAVDENVDHFKPCIPGPSDKTGQIQDLKKYSILLSKDKLVQIQLLRDVNNLPADLLVSGNPISICLKIKEPKKVLSYTRCRIGAKIMRKSRSKDSCKKEGGFGQTKGDNSCEVTVTFYSGSGTVWMYTWKSSSVSSINYPSIPKLKKVETRRSLLQLQDQEDPTMVTGGRCVIETILSQVIQAGCPIILPSTQTKVRKLIKHFGGCLFEKLLSCSEQIWDPKIAAWLCQENDDELDNSENWISIEKLIDLHLEEEDRVVLAHTLNWPTEAKESYVSWILMSKLSDKLTCCSLWDHFRTVEMPSILPIVSMEINGFCFNVTEFERLQKILKLKAALLELKAYKIVGRQFNISSSKEIQKVLFGDLKLIRPQKIRGVGKEVLLKLDHVIATIIIEWRKVHHALQLIFPFSQARNPKTGRIHGVYSHFSITGRIIMAEPSIQFIPRDFDLKISFTKEEIESLRSDITIMGSKVSSLLSVIDEGLKLEQERLHDPDLSSSSSFITIENLASISMRNAFCASSEDFILVAADYSQLELRILAILCEDTNLIKTLNSGKDVFKAIASGWKKIPLQQVSTDLRQEAKSIVYAIIYGMGKNSLSQKMKVTVDTAAEYIEQFMKSYPGVRCFITNTIKSCKQKGYVETILGRRRFLPHINSQDKSLKSQAERQAVNTRVQGSASDLVKKSMIRVQTMISSLTESTNASKGQVGGQPDISLPCYIVLNLHDELIFEVRKDCLNAFIPRLRDAMEKSLTLKVHVALPVNIKIGTTWGSLVPYE